MGALRLAADAPVEGKDFTLDPPSLAMIWVAPGSLVLRGTHDIGDTTEVTLTRGYWLGRTEVTQAQWQAIIDHVPVPSYFKGSDRPVEQIAWETVMIFCRLINEQEQAAGRLPAGYAYGLPTEAQWEYACRAGTPGPFAGDVAAMGWFDENSGEQSHPVAGKQPNAWGFHDMHGNIMEWCADWFGGYPGGRVNDPTGPTRGLFKVLRGGNWGSPAGLARSGYRNFGYPSAGNRGIGFRLVLAPIQ